MSMSVRHPLPTPPPAMDPISCRASRFPTLDASLSCARVFAAVSRAWIGRCESFSAPVPWQSRHGTLCATAQTHACSRAPIVQHIGHTRRRFPRSRNACSKRRYAPHAAVVIAMWSNKRKKNQTLVAGGSECGCVYVWVCTYVRTTDQSQPALTTSREPTHKQHRWHFLYMLVRTSHTHKHTHHNKYYFELW